MNPEVVHGEKKDIQSRVQARGGQAGRRSRRDSGPGGKAQDTEIARLRKEVAKLKMERDILK